MNFHKVLHMGQRLAKGENKVLIKCMQWYMRLVFHCDVPLTADIANSVYFNHNAFGVVINPNAIIRDGVNIQHSVTIGERDATHKAPLIEENVTIGARAIILGNIRIGKNVNIGAGAVVISDIPSDCTVVGVPARVIFHNEERK